MRSSLRTSFRRALALLLSLLLLSSVSPTALASSTKKVSGTYCQTDARAMLSELNDFRTGSGAWYWNEDNRTKTVCKGLGKLKYDYTLEKIAMLRAAEIVVRWSHIRPNGQSCFSAYDNYDYLTMGENLAMGTNMTRSAAMYGLKEDDEFYDGQGHRRNMLLREFTAVGIAHFQCNGIDYWVQEFGSPALDTRVTAARNSAATVTVDTSTSGSSSKSIPSKAKVSVSWKRDKKATGYQLQYSTNKKFKKGVKTIKIKKNKTTSTVIKNLKTKKTYYIRVRSYRKKGKKTKYGRWSKTSVVRT